MVGHEMVGICAGVHPIHFRHIVESTNVLKFQLHTWGKTSILFVVGDFESKNPWLTHKIALVCNGAISDAESKHHEFLAAEGAMDSFGEKLSLFPGTSESRALPSLPPARLQAQETSDPIRNIACLGELLIYQLSLFSQA